MKINKLVLMCSALFFLAFTYGAENKDVRAYHPRITISTMIHVHMMGDKASSAQEIFYSVYDSSNGEFIYKNKIGKSDFVIEIPHLTDFDVPEPNRAANRSYKYSIVIYGVEYNGYSVAIPFQIKLNVNDLKIEIAKSGKDCTDWIVSLHQVFGFYRNKEFGMDLSAPVVFSDNGNNTSTPYYNVCKQRISSDSKIDIATGNMTPSKIIQYNINVNLNYKLSHYLSINTQNQTDEYKSENKF